VSRFRHQALFYEGDEGFLDGTVPFVRAGLDASEPVLVVVDSRKARLLREALGVEADGVVYLDMLEVGRNPARIIPLWREHLDEARAAGTALRGIGEPVWPGRSAAELAECRRHESLLNVAFDDGPGWELLCPYDAAALPDEVLEAARCSHPIVSDGGGEEASAAYAEEAQARPFAGRLPEPTGPIAELRYAAGDIAGVRAFVREVASEAGLGRERLENLVLAVSELATNSVRHASGSGSVRLWTEAGRLLCEVRDAGFIEDPLAGRVLPPAEALGGRGIWIVNQLCDLVQVRSSAAGTAVRVHMGGLGGPGLRSSRSAAAQAQPDQRVDERGDDRGADERGGGRRFHMPTVHGKRRDRDHEGELRG
jgi:anti-sigma regulatory factor (Ser/Thr protein kinase)